MRYRVGFDIGGTFTDFVLFDPVTSRLAVHKCLTTPKDPSAGALAGMEELLRAAGLGWGDIGHLVHGTTLVTNAIIEREGATVGLLTTRGFRDTLEMGIEQRYDIYDLFLQFPAPLAARAFRREIDERVSRDGLVVTPLDLAQARAEVQDLVARGVDAIAVCFLHAYKNPAHERLVGALLAREFPGISVSLSSEVVPELREYERGTTTTANAFVQPLMKPGVLNEELLTLVAENVRKHEQVLGDIHAMVSANASGARRLLDFMAEYGLEDLEPLATVIQNRSESAMREAIRRVPDGVYESEIYSDGMGTPQRYRVRVEVRGDEIDVDFPDAPPQTARGGSNCTYGYTAAHTTYPLKCILSPTVPSNAGSYRPFRVTAPLGSTLNCVKPAAVNTRTRTGWYIAPNLFMALHRAVPDQVQAFTGLPASVLFYGTDAGGRVYNDHLFQGGGQGAGSRGDGKSGLLWPTSAGNTSIELFETRTPVLVLQKGYLADSAGAGRHRGGLGQVLSVRKLHDDGLPTLASVHPDGVLTRTRGLFGGQPGGAVRGALLDASGAVVEDYGIGGLVTLVRTDQVLEVRLAGGSGYGDPLERSIALVQADLDSGYVSAEGAARDYGCVVGAGGRIGAAATASLRARRRAERRR